MSETFWLGRLAHRIQDAELVAHHRYRLTSDTVEECLHAWRDSQAARFASAVDEPQREMYEPLGRHLRLMGGCLHELAADSDETEALSSGARAACGPCIELARRCEQKAEAALYHAEEARQLAGRARRGAASTEAALAALGRPPL